MYETFSLALAPINASQGQWIRMKSGLWGRDWMVGMLGEGGGGGGMTDQPSRGMVTVNGTVSSAG